ncbi:MAG TPA: hypothetical protein DDW52_05390 [Planctomycetaceae bacterium]|nr:hypothetical protein [Planctomycetaceae bacterium]
MFSTRRLVRFRRRLKYSKAALFFYRYRYLVGFTVFGGMSVLLELYLRSSVIPDSIPDFARTLIAFLSGLVFSYLLNATFNFRVPYRYFLSTFVRFAAVSVASFALNLGFIYLLKESLDVSYAASRLVSSGLLFSIAYVVHRRLTFDLDRNFGIAVYAAPEEYVRRVFLKVGRNTDHIHIDLVDSTFNPAARVDLRKIKRAREFWPDSPFALHLMTRRPDHWLEKTLPDVDWILFSLASDCNLTELIARCHLAGKKAGVVWHLSDPLSDLYEQLNHVDFVMVLGIAKPGFSGQTVAPEALDVIQMLERVKHRYGFELMFDGSVNSRTILDIPAKYIVAASSVLKAHKPAKMIYTLKTGARHARRAA